MNLVDRLKASHSFIGDPLHREAYEEIERLMEIIANYERDHSAGAGMAPIRKLGETTVEERSRSTGFSQRSRGYGSEDI